MTGVPINRVMSADGRWAYTLYLRPSGVPFVHALDTTARRAVCIDLPSLSNLDVGNGQLELRQGGATLQVAIDGEAQVVVDTRTFSVSARGGHSGAAPAPPTAHRRRTTRDQGDIPWELIVLSIATLGLVAAAGAGAASRRAETTVAAPKPR
jgi:hypothetical protein